MSMTQLRQRPRGRGRQLPVHVRKDDTATRRPAPDTTSHLSAVDSLRDTLPLFLPFHERVAGLLLRAALAAPDQGA